MKSHLTLILSLFCLAGTGQYKIDRKYFDNLLENGEYARVFVEGNEILKKPYGKTSHLVHYYIGKSLCCRGYIPQGKEWFRFIREKMKIDNTFKEELVEAETNCRQVSGGSPVRRAPAIYFINYSGGHSLPGGVTGKGGFTLKCRSGDEESYEHLEKNDSLEKRLFSADRKKEALGALRTFLPANRYDIDTSGRFNIVTLNSKNYSDRGINTVTEKLEFAYQFFKYNYKLRETDKLFTVYLMPDKYELSHTAYDVHKIHISPAGNIGYSSLGDLSLLGIGNTRSVGTLYHELFHLLIRSEIGDIPAWLDEGMACLYSVYTTSGNELMGSYSTWRVHHFTLLIGLKSTEKVRVPSLKQLIGLNWQDFEGGSSNDRCSASVNYALSNLFLLFVQKNNLLTSVVETFKNRHELSADSLLPGPDDSKLLEIAFNKNIDQITGEFYSWLQERYGIKMNDLLKDRPGFYLQDVPTRFHNEIQQTEILLNQIDTAALIKSTKLKKLKQDWNSIQFSIKRFHEKYSEDYLKELVEVEMDDIGTQMNIEDTPEYGHWVDETHQKISVFQTELKKIISKKQ